MNVKIPDNEAQSGYINLIDIKISDNLIVKSKQGLFLSTRLKIEDGDGYYYEYIPLNNHEGLLDTKYNTYHRCSLIESKIPDCEKILVRFPFHIQGIYEKYLGEVSVITNKKRCEYCKGKGYIKAEGINGYLHSYHRGSFDNDCNSCKGTGYKEV